MALRRLAVALPLAVLVAVFAHLAGFGSDHAPGGEHAAGLVRLLGAGLALLGLGSFFGAVLRSGDRVVTPNLCRRTVLSIAAVAAVAFAAIELAEGHVASAGTLRAWLALLPMAGLVALLARYVGRAVARAGRAFAGYSRMQAATTAGHFGRAARTALVARRLCCCGTNRGRAPPEPA